MRTVIAHVRPQGQRRWFDFPEKKTVLVSLYKDDMLLFLPRYFKYFLVLKDSDNTVPFNPSRLHPNGIRQHFQSETITMKWLKWARSEMI